MKKIQYILNGLDCANCAAKIEKKVGKLSGVQEVNVSFATKKMYLEVEDAYEGQIKKEVVSLIHDVEPDVICEEIAGKQAVHHHEHDEEKHHHEECGCGHHHEHDEKEHHHEGCGCGHHHEHGEEDHHHEECGCGHHHEHGEEDHHHEGCNCGHDHAPKEERVLANAMKFNIHGLDCASCAQKVEDAILKQDNIADASLNFSSSLLFVKLQKNEDLQQLQERLQKVADQVEPGVLLSTTKTESTEQKNSQRLEVIRLMAGILLFVLGIILEEQSYAMWIFLAGLIVAGGKVIYTAVRNILRGEVFDENFLMSIATIGAFAIGNYEEGVAVMIFYEIGEMFQAYAVNRSRKSISSLMNIRAEYANKLVDGKEVRVAPEEVHIGDIIQIRAGERVPLDGVLVQGTSSLDTSALTGESLPRDVNVEDEILAGSVNINGLIQVRVTKEFGESTVSRILELVENAGSKKAPMEKFITKFARIYTPVVVGLAVLLVILPMLFIKDAIFYDWLYRALTFLVVSCPCALVVSIPLGLFAGIGGASKKGILIKGGNYLEALSDIDTVVFDKTGTLTKGSFHVDQVIAKDRKEDALLEIGAYGESYSNHPIAQSIVKAYGKTIDKQRLSNFEEIAGHGIQVEIDGVTTLLGNTKLMRSHNIAYETNTPVGTIVHIAQQDAYLGYIVINDEIKETSAKAIQALKACGVKTCVMLTGDREEVALEVGRKLKLDQVYAQLLPADKVERVEELLAKEEKGKLAFVGDGINDAPVLARADIGVAMGGIGSDAAIEAADVVLMKDDPKALADAITISHKTKRILWQNIIFSLGIKIGVLLLTIFGMSTMWMGVFADVGVTLLAVLNSMRALKTSN